jgi:hypothetical protein
MPRNVLWRGSSWAQLQALPEEMRKDALTAIGGLLADPMPATSQTYPPVPNAYQLTTAYVTIFYRIVDEEIDIVYLRPNT